ncbi:DJ-1/PfpI family protein [Natranaerobius trueperi]|uniref:DJ-1/PfpI family protein n=1 Tax=Natranaerobius trueperi TaxID=759412 RepID=UPI00197C24AB|nr:DJ-1/PfpI family protein [Natranaerobius trueperi]
MTPFNVETIAESNEKVNCRHGLQVQPDKSFDTNNNYDILVVPGGLGVREQLNNEKIRL